MGSHSLSRRNYLADRIILPRVELQDFILPWELKPSLKTSLIAYTGAALEKEADAIVKLAEIEGLSAHAHAVKVRMKKYVKEKGKGDE